MKLDLSKYSLKELQLAGNQHAENLKEDLNKLSKKELVNLVSSFVGGMLSSGEQMMDGNHIHNPDYNDVLINETMCKTSINYYDLFKNQLIEFINR